MLKHITSKARYMGAALAGSAVLALVALGSAEPLPGTMLQQFELRYAAAPTGGTELVPMPTIAIVPLGSAPISLALGTQLTDAVDAERADVPDGERFGVMTRPAGAQTRWAFAALTQPREANSDLARPFSESLITCLYSLEEGIEIAALNLLLSGGALMDNVEREAARRGGRQMLDHWRAERCATARNDLPFIRNNAAKIHLATAGMLTDEFDGAIFNGQGLLDSIDALYPLFYQPGGLWAADRSPRLESIFASAVDKGFLTPATVEDIIDTEFRSFWDWAIYVLRTKQTVVRSFPVTVASHCMSNIQDLTRPFTLRSCIAGGTLELITLRVQGNDYVAAQGGGQ